VILVLACLVSIAAPDGYGLLTPVCGHLILSECLARQAEAAAASMMGVEVTCEAPKTETAPDR
jgi:hypothetical protein